MTRFAGVLLILLAAALPACDSTEPLTSPSTQTVELRFIVEAGSIFEVDMWDRYVDPNSNGQVDPGEPSAGLWCGEDAFFSRVGVTQAPWEFTVDIRIVRNGTVVQEVLTTPNAFSRFLSATLEDPTVILGETPVRPSNAEPGYAYANPRRLPDTSYDYFTACLPDVDVPTFGQVGGLPVPVQISLQKGDTLIVTAGQSPNGITNYGPAGPLHADVFVDGVQLSLSAIDGTNEVGSTGVLRFSYQFR